MIPADKLLCTFFAGCIVTTCVWLIIDDLHMAAHAGESMACRDRPDTTAYMARLPGESHTVEACVQVMRFGSPNWIPQFSHPLKQEGK